MRSWFNDNLKPNARVVSSFDPFNDQYVLNISTSCSLLYTFTINDAGFQLVASKRISSGPFSRKLNHLSAVLPLP